MKTNLVSQLGSNIQIEIQLKRGKDETNLRHPYYWSRFGEISPLFQLAIFEPILSKNTLLDKVSFLQKAKIENLNMTSGHTVQEAVDISH